MRSHSRMTRRVGLVLFVSLVVVSVMACGPKAVEQQAPQGGAEATPEGPISSCGDALCEKGEEDTCCMDCGCKDPAKICDRYRNMCVDKVVLDDQVKAQLIEKYKPWPLIEITDEIYSMEATKLLKFDCGDKDKKCIQLVYVGAQGKIIKEQKSQ